MMDPNKINRPVATVNRDAWYLRFYLWLWAADVEKVDFCRLFWGFVFAIPFLLIRVFILIPILFVVDKIIWFKRTGFWKMMDGIEWFVDRTFIPAGRFVYRTVSRMMPESREKKPQRTRNRWEPMLEPSNPWIGGTRKPSKLMSFFKSLRANGGEAFLANVGKTADKGVEVAQKTWPYTRWIFIFFGAIVGAIVALACGYALWLLAQVLPVVAGAVWYALTVAASGVAWFFVTLFSSKYIWLVPLILVGVVGFGIIVAAILNSNPMRSAGTKTKEKTLGFGGAMKLGVKSVKYRTCPVIKVEE
jgi:hypothetical protein